MILQKATKKMLTDRYNIVDLIPQKYPMVMVDGLISNNEMVAVSKFSLTEKRFLHGKTVYVTELEESLVLPEYVSARSNPKSTTGRLDIHARLITENGQSFDDVSFGYEGRLFLEIASCYFDLFLSL